MRLFSLFFFLATTISAQDGKPDDLTQDVGKAIGKLVSERHSESQDARTELIDIGRRATPQLVKALQEKNMATQQRHMICEILGKIRFSSPGVLGALSGELENQEEFGTSVASAAAAALASIGDGNAIPALLKIFEAKDKNNKRIVDRDLQLKYECIRAFGILRANAAVGVLREALKDKSTTQLGEGDEWAHLIAAAAAEALGYIKAEEALMDIGSLLGDFTKDPFSERELRWHAARALARITGESRGSLNERNTSSQAIVKWKEWYDKEKKAREDARKKEEEARKKREEEARKKREEEARKKKEEEAKKEEPKKEEPKKEEPKKEEPKKDKES